MNKTKLSRAIALCIGAASTSVSAIDVEITSMDFDGIFLAEKQLRDDTGDFGHMQSVDDFFGNHWAAVGIAYFEAGNPVPTEDNDAVSDEANVTNGAQPASWGVFTQTTNFNAGTGEYTWSGTSVSGKDGVQRPFEYTFQLAPNEVAWGTLFNWNDNQSIPVLNVMDCTDPADCAGVFGTPMVNGPFVGSDPIFNGGLPPMSCGESFHTNVQGAFDINIADSLAAACSDAKGPVTLVSIGIPVNGGTATEDGVNITYTPPFDGFSGPDSFSYTANDGVTESSNIYKVQIGGTLQNNFGMLDRSGKVFGGTNDVEMTWDEINFNASTLDAKGIPTDINFDGVMTMHSDEPFFNFTWNSHHVRIFKNETAAPVTYNFDVTCTTQDYDSGTVDCMRPLADQGAKTRYMTLTLQPGEIGAHVLFDWGKNDATTECGQANCTIDVALLWKENAQWDDHGDAAPKNALWLGPAGVPPATDAIWRLVSSDVNGDGVNGTPMIDGAFEGSYSNFNYKPDKSGTPLPPYTGEISDVDVGGFSFSLWTLFAGVFSVLGLRRFKSKK